MDDIFAQLNQDLRDLYKTPHQRELIANGVRSGRLIIEKGNLRPATFAELEAFQRGYQYGLEAAKQSKDEQLEAIREEVAQTRRGLGLLGFLHFLRE